MLTLFFPRTKPDQEINKIAGAGVAGMTAALNLKKSGHDVVIYEKQSTVGGSRHGDYEGLENWIFNQPMTQFFESHGFDFEKLDSVPIQNFSVHTEKRSPFIVRSRTPFFYMVKRGPGSDCFDRQLYEQCHRAGVDFKFDSPAPGHIDIDSTGSKKAAAYIKGVNFTTPLANQVHLLLGQKFAPKGYGYLIIQNGHGTVATAFKKTKNELSDPLHESIKYFRGRGFDIPNKNIFGSRGSFSNLNMKFFQRPYRIGEAGGFQDFLFGFGMRMAMRSGLAAAYHIKGEKYQAKRILRNLHWKRHISFINRMLYERLNDEQMAKSAALFARVDEPLDLLSRAYQWNFKNMLRWMRLQDQYEIRTA